MVRVDDTEGDGLSFFNLAQSKGQRFFRLEEKLVYGHRGTDSDQPAFYERQYLNSWNPDLTLSQFAANHSNAEVLNGISWDPTTACYFEEFNTTPEEHNADLEPDDLERRIYDFTLNKNETALFQQNGFVVSPRVRAFLPLQDGTPAGPPQIPPTCVDLYYALWTDDLPVFITADSVLDAWHQTFASMLEELDETAVYPVIKQLVKYDLATAFSSTVDSWDDSSANPEEIADVQQAIEDVTLYLDMARAFLDTTPPSSSATALEWYNDLIDPDPNQLVKVGLYGDEGRYSRPNLYKVRGRYTRTGVLSAHFRTVVWLSRAQFHIAHSTELDRGQRDRELRAAILLALALRDGGLLVTGERSKRCFKELQDNPMP